ncbi:lipopolysaccharide biosynthesis protein [Hahella sp. HN01]|uniref:lipopolysaccharide biosynthesis protein n=1 Tax=Hahella sp. HN01 TaxID=2847262 RepID=UPI001C1EDC63|nr:oligosaccharide flippase family protein [Hahella sp. HN01]MBU6950601.1 oligosaccharide flippase family protein [Hahella sp. HN01]
MSSSKVKKLFSDSLIYGVAIIARSLSSIILLPLYTRYLSTEGYGVIELLSMTVDFAAIFFGARVGQSFLRYYGLASNEKEKSEVFSTSFSLLSFTHLVGAVLLIVFSTSIGALLFGGQEYHAVLVVFSLNLLFGGMSEIPLAWLRANGKAASVLFFSLAKLVLQISLCVGLLVYLEWGVMGAALASVLAQGTVAVLLTLYCIKSNKIILSKEMAKKLVGFSWPIILAAVSMFFITYGDRFFIRTYLTLSDVGIYALAYKFGFILYAIGWQPFQSMWEAERYRIYKEESQHYLFPAIFSFMSVLLVFMAFGLSIWIGYFLQLMSDQEFWPAAEYVPVIILGYVFLSWTGYCNLGIFTSGNTKVFGVSSMFTALFCLVAYWLAIPSYGLMGAAVVTAIAFFVRFFVIHKLAKARFNMKLNWYPAVSSLCLASVLFWVNEIGVINTGNLFLSNVLVCFLFLIMLFVLKIVKVSDLKTVYSTVAKKAGA